MKHRHPSIQLAVVACSLTLSAGCINLDPKPDPTRYYTIDPAGPREIPAAETGDQVLVILVLAAGYLDQPTIIERRGGHEVVPLALHRWAEPVSQGLPRVMADLLQQQLPGILVTADQRRFSPVKHPSALVSVERFELTDENEAVVRLQVILSQPGDGAVARNRTFTASHAFDPEGDRVGAGVAALAAALEDTARQIARWR